MIFLSGIFHTKKRVNGSAALVANSLNLQVQDSFLKIAPLKMDFIVFVKSAAEKNLVKNNLIRAREN